MKSSLVDMNSINYVKLYCGTWSNRTSMILRMGKQFTKIHAACVASAITTALNFHFARVTQGSSIISLCTRPPGNYDATLNKEECLINGVHVMPIDFFLEI